MPACSQSVPAVEEHKKKKKRGKEERYENVICVCLTYVLLNAFLGGREYSISVLWCRFENGGKNGLRWCGKE